MRRTFAFRGRHSRQGLCNKGDREGIRHRQRPNTLDHFYRHKIEPPARGLHEVPSTACIQPPNPPRIKSRVEEPRHSLCVSVRLSLARSLPNDAPTDDRCNRATLETSPIKWRVARFAGRFRCAEGPGTINRKNRQVCGLVRSNRAL